MADNKTPIFIGINSNPLVNRAFREQQRLLSERDKRENENKSKITSRKVLGMGTKQENRFKNALPIVSNQNMSEAQRDEEKKQAIKDLLQLFNESKTSADEHKKEYNFDFINKKDERKIKAHFFKDNKFNNKNNNKFHYENRANFYKPKLYKKKPFLDLKRRPSYLEKLEFPKRSATPEQRFAYEVKALEAKRNYYEMFRKFHYIIVTPLGFFGNFQEFSVWLRWNPNAMDIDCKPATDFLEKQKAIKNARRITRQLGRGAVALEHFMSKQKKSKLKKKLFKKRNETRKIYLNTLLNKRKKEKKIYSSIVNKLIKIYQLKKKIQNRLKLYTNIKSKGVIQPKLSKQKVLNTNLFNFKKKKKLKKILNVKKKKEVNEDKDEEKDIMKIIEVGKSFNIYIIYPNYQGKQDYLKRYKNKLWYMQQNYNKYKEYWKNGFFGSHYEFQKILNQRVFDPKKALAKPWKLDRFRINQVNILRNKQKKSYYERKNQAKKVNVFHYGKVPINKSLIYNKYKQEGIMDKQIYEGFKGNEDTKRIISPFRDKKDIGSNMLVRQNIVKIQQPFSKLIENKVEQKQEEQTPRVREFIAMMRKAKEENKQKEKFKNV